MKKTGLGKGLSALIEETVPPLASTDTLCRIPVRQIDPNPQQPRRRFDEESLRLLADSIKANGVIQPIIVRREKDRYMIVAGERRWRACRLAGLDEVPAILRDVDRQTLYEMALIENMQREDLNPVEEARALDAYLRDYGLTQEQAAARLGRSRPALANSVRLLQLPEPLQQKLADGELTMGHARCLLGISDKDRQLALGLRIIREGLSVRQAEQLAKAEKKPRRSPPPLTEGLEELSDSMRRVFGTRVVVSGTEEKGRIQIEYASREDVERIYEVIQKMV